MNKTDKLGAHFQIANESMGYGPDLMKEKLFLWTTTYSQ